MSTPAIFVINLDSSPDRLDEIAANLSAIGLDFIRVPAVDGRLQAPEQDPDYDERAARAMMGRSLMGGEIGCYKSHIRALGAFLASGAEHGLVLEDDAELSEDAMMVLGNVLDWLAASGRKDWRVINLGHPVLHSATLLAEFGRYGLLAAHYAPMGAFALLWSRRGALEFLGRSDKISAPVDNALQNWLCRKGGGLAISPPLARVSKAISVIDETPRDAKPLRGKYRRVWYYGIAKQRRLWRNRLWALAHRAGLLDHR